jgi:3-hydroxyacyl-CoA dehydrogenase
MTLQTVRLERLGDSGGSAVALVTIDNPPVNAGSRQVRADLLAAFTGLREDTSLDGVVLTGANAHFVAGGDIREFDRPPEPPHLPDVIAAIETFPRPVVAAIDGAALGGGYELALGCDARVATARSIVGLPEVTLGLIPGAGGTQRLPRLIGIAKSIPIITSGRRLTAAEALELGMIDAIADGGVTVAAAGYLKSMNGEKRVLSSRDVKPDMLREIEVAEADALATGQGSDAVTAAIAAVRSAATTPIEEALQEERRISLRLRAGPEARALRERFFSERAARRGG